MKRLGSEDTNLKREKETEMGYGAAILCISTAERPELGRWGKGRTYEASGE